MNYELETPTIPPGKDFARDSFYWRYRERFTTPKRYGWKIKPSAYEWFEREQRRAALNGEQFPPAPVFVAIMRPMPQPYDGKNERPGRVPRTGK